MKQQEEIKTKIKTKISSESKSNGITKAKRTTLRLTDDELFLLRNHYKAVCEEFDGSVECPPSFNTTMRALLMLALHIQAEQQEVATGLA